MDAGKGLRVWGVWFVEKAAGTFPGNGIGSLWGITHSSPPSPLTNFLVGDVYFEPKFLLKIKYFYYFILNDLN